MKGVEEEEEDVSARSRAEIRKDPVRPSCLEAPPPIPPQHNSREKKGGWPEMEESPVL